MAYDASNGHVTDDPERS